MGGEGGAQGIYFHTEVIILVITECVGNCMASRRKKKERVSITRQVADVYIYNIRHIIACVDAEDD